MHRTILVVDDDALVRNTMEKFFSKVGYSVILASSGHEALAKMAEQDVRVFILDLMMPGMDGIQLCGEIRKAKGAECVIYALTGYAANYDDEACRKAGFDKLFLKPFRLDAVLQAIEQACEKVQGWADAPKG